MNQKLLTVAANQALFGREYIKLESLTAQVRVQRLGRMLEQQLKLPWLAQIVKPIPISRRA